MCVLLNIDDAISDINAVKTALSSPNTLSTTGGDIISGAVGGYSTGGSEGAITGVFSGLFTSVLKLDPLMSGSISNLSGQALGLVTDEFKDNGMGFELSNIEFKQINLFEVGVSGVANKASTVFKALPATQPTLGRTLVGETGSGLYVGTAGAASPEYSVGELKSDIDREFNSEVHHSLNYAALRSSSNTTAGCL